MNQIKKIGSLCPHCRNAQGGCSWSQRLEPVDGWKAEETLLRGRVPGYLVKECPLFRPMDPTAGQRGRCWNCAHYGIDLDDCLCFKYMLCTEPDESCKGWERRGKTRG